MADIFALQTEVTNQIVIALNLELLSTEAARPTGNPDALDYILRGRAARNKSPSPEKYTESISLFERALALDPRSVEAQSELVRELMARVVDFMADSAATDIARAEGLVEQALATSPRNPMVRLAKGMVLRAQTRYREAIPEYQAALASNWNWVSVLGSLAICKFYSGSPEEVIPLLEQAIRISPRDPQLGTWYQFIGLVHMLELRTDQAIQWFEKACSAIPKHSSPHGQLAAAYALKDDTERAAAELAKARRAVGGDRFTSISRLQASGPFAVTEIRARFEATFFAGLRKAGMPEE